jgi:hypothetical protein
LPWRLANLKFNLGEAVVIFLLFATQLLFADPQFRFYYAILYIILALAMMVLRKDIPQGVFGLFARGAPVLKKH